MSETGCLLAVLLQPAAINKIFPLIRNSGLSGTTGSIMIAGGTKQNDVHQLYLTNLDYNASLLACRSQCLSVPNAEELLLAFRCSTIFSTCGFGGDTKQSGRVCLDFIFCEIHWKVLGGCLFSKLQC